MVRLEVLIRKCMPEHRSGFGCAAVAVLHYMQENYRLEFLGGDFSNFFEGQAKVFMDNEEKEKGSKLQVLLRSKLIHGPGFLIAISNRGDNNNEWSDELKIEVYPIPGGRTVDTVNISGIVQMSNVKNHPDVKSLFQKNFCDHIRPAIKTVLERSD